MGVRRPASPRSPTSPSSPHPALVSGVSGPTASTARPAKLPQSRRCQRKAKLPPAFSRVGTQPFLLPQKGQSPGQGRAINLQQPSQPLLRDSWRKVQRLQERELRRTQSTGTQFLVINLSHHSRRPSQIRAHARQRNHRLSLTLRSHVLQSLYIDVFTSIAGHLILCNNSESLLDVLTSILQGPLTEPSKESQYELFSTQLPLSLHTLGNSGNSRRAALWPQPLPEESQLVRIESRQSTPLHRCRPRNLYVAAVLPARSGFYHFSASRIPTIQYGILSPSRSVSCSS